MKVEDIIDQIRDGIDIFNKKYFYINNSKHIVESCTIEWITLSNGESIDDGDNTVQILPNNKDNKNVDNIFRSKIINIRELFNTKQDAKYWL